METEGYAQQNPMLDSLIAQKVAEGYQVQFRASEQAVLRRPGTKINHLLHLILSIITGGLWLLVWVLLAATSRYEKTIIVRHPLPL